MKTFGVISLGCSKNAVDTEYMLGMMTAAGYVLVTRPEDADILIVNTCGFIAPAKEESINTILEMAQYKEHGRCSVLVVTGCLSQRYREELKAEMPEVDLFLGVREYETLVPKLNAITGEKGTCANSHRILTTPPYSAYLRIADGCDNCCTYCAIPLIRGPRASVPMEPLLEEAERLANSGVTELTVIAQDTSGYGIDIYGKPMLKELLEELAKIEKLHWVRVLYTYPNTVTEELIDSIYSNPKILNYLDMPIQHIDSTMLRRMNRHGERSHIEEILRYVRKTAPGFILRSTAIVGFPGETEEQFEDLLSFVREYKLDRLGAFTYSPEDNTPAAEMPNQIPEEVKDERLARLMEAQQKISLSLNKSRIGQELEILIEGEENGLLKGRSYAEAPDVDGNVYIRAKQPHCAGEYIRARLTEASEYDMWGEEL